MNSTTPSKPANDHTFQVIKGIFVALGLCLILWIGKIMIIDQKEIQTNAYNPRLNEEEETVIRGSILAASGEVLAYTEMQEDGSQGRVYPYGEAFAHVTGYVGRGKAGLELAANDLLLQPPDLLSTLKSWAKEEALPGCNVITTIDFAQQQKIYEQMAAYKGAVVITEPSTGKCKVFVSTPSYHPADIKDHWETIADREDSPLYTRATQGLYAPGSTFKIITALTMYRNMSDYQTYRYVCPGAYQIGSETLGCAGGTVHGEMDIENGFADSCNGFFASAGVLMGGDAIRSTAEYLKLGSSYEFILPQSETSVVVSDDDSDGMIAQTAIGQGETQFTPFAMNMLTCAIANQGILYTPYMIDQVVDAEGKQVQKNLPKLWGTVMKAEEAAFLERLMAGVIEHGTATSLQMDGCTVYGKTGTAQVDQGEDHSWFTGYTKVNGKVDLAITILIENGGSDKRAVPLAQQILNDYYGS
ncbi:MAG: penicillin-binding protein 2 [Lachnospiraceae bacterium]|nr:penicillin-binding protein 2 [Lachnospiraceae bacterium]